MVTPEMTTVDQLLKPDPPRDRYGRYLLRLPGDTKPRGRTRVTTFIKALDQGDGLIAWKATATMVGALRNPGLHAKWAAIFAQSQDPWYHSDELKTKCKKLVDECADHGGAQSRADLGTALHSMLELVARHRNGECDMPSLVDPYANDIKAFLATLDTAEIGFTGWNEVCVYIPDYDLVGTFDALTDPVGTPTAPLTITDYKTETSTDYKALAHAAQLAAYSLATHRIIFPSNPDDTATLEPLPQFDHDTGLIIHLPAGQATCTLHAVDLEQGREALELASKMRRMDAQRKRKDTGGLMRPWTGEPCPASTPTNDPSTDLPNPSVTPSMSTSGGSSTPTETHILPAASSSSPPTEQDLKSRLRAIHQHQPDLLETPCPEHSAGSERNVDSDKPKKPSKGSPNGAAETGLGLPTPTNGPSTETDLKTRLRDIHQHQPDLAHLIGRRWPPGVPAIRDPWTLEHVEFVAALLDQVDIEGPMADPSQLVRIAWMFDQITIEQEARITTWITEAASDPNRYRPLALGAGNHTTRRVSLAEVCLLIAGNYVNDLEFQILIWETLERGETHLPIGCCLGSMDWRQAQHLLTLTQLHLNLHTTIESEPT